jgi:hypothetical protein
MIEKRKIIFGTYDTAEEGLWTLTGWALSDAEQKTEYLDLPGANGRLDVSTALTDGEPVYNDRTLTATFECSEGTRLEREDRISRMVNWLDGWRMNITLPDDPLHYVTGRVHVARLYNDMAHASVQVTATCDPWRYNVTETAVGLQATAAEQTTALINSGRRSMVPSFMVMPQTVHSVCQAPSVSVVADVSIIRWPSLWPAAGNTIC